MQIKHVPLRSCVICNTKSSKRDLLRIVRTENGSITLDLTGKANGRGAYLCKEARCWEKVALTDRLSKAMRVDIDQASARALFLSYESAGLVDDKHAAINAWGK